MASKVVKFARLSDRDLKKVAAMPRLAAGDRMELHVRRKDGKEQTLALPAVAVDAVETLIDRLLSGDRVAVLAEDQELSPTEISPIPAARRVADGSG